MNGDCYDVDADAIDTIIVERGMSQLYDIEADTPAREPAPYPNHMEASTRQALALPNTSVTAMSELAARCALQRQARRRNR